MKGVHQTWNKSLISPWVTFEYFSYEIVELSDRIGMVRRCDLTGESVSLGLGSQLHVPMPDPVSLAPWDCSTAMLPARKVLASPQLMLSFINSHLGWDVVAHTFIRGTWEAEASGRPEFGSQHHRVTHNHMYL